jgi:hypothetical protein
MAGGFIRLVGRFRREVLPLLGLSATRPLSVVAEQAIRQFALRVSYLKRRGWEELEFGELTDVDHMAGRSKLWMNSTLFTMHTSHSWIRYIAFV